jgi:hypothetical protein
MAMNPEQKKFLAEALRLVGTAQLSLPLAKFLDNPESDGLWALLILCVLIWLVCIMFAIDLLKNDKG